MAESAPISRDLDGGADDPFRGTAYRLVQPIAVGGMSEIYLVEHVQLGTQHAAKVLRGQFAGNARIIDRLRVEGQTLSRLAHPHIVASSDVGTTADGRPFIVMEYMTGWTLEELIAARGSLTVYEAVAHTGNLLSALAEAHEIGVIHRDIKPSNIFIAVSKDGVPMLKVLDFGVARVLPEVSALAPRPVEVPTDDNVVIGTPRFVSPEGAMGQKVDQRADIYATGLILYVMLTGKGPFDHISRDAGVIAAHAFEAPQPPSALASNPIPPEIDQIVLRALSKSPDDRFATAWEFHADLERVWHALNCPTHLRDTGIASISMLRQYGFTPTPRRKITLTNSAPLAFIVSFFTFGLTAALVTYSCQRGPVP
jgi:eukaryotic-like serine/threonine-protein kinase